MGLFVSIPHSSPVITPVPNSSPSSPTTGLSSLTSLASHTRRLGNLLRRLRRARLADIEEGLSFDISVVPAAEAAAHVAQPSGPSGRRRALLIGISYCGELLNTHQDVDRYRNVLIDTHATTPSNFITFILYWDFEATYGYRPEDIVMLKDDPALPDHFQPTRENIVSNIYILFFLDPICMGLTLDFGRTLASGIEESRCECGSWGPFQVSL